MLLELGTRTWCSSVWSPWDFYTFPFPCCGCRWLLWEDRSRRHAVGVCRQGRALPRSSCFNLPFGRVAGTPDVSVEGRHGSPDQAEVGQPAAAAWMPPIPPAPSLAPNGSKGETRETQVLGVEHKAHGGKMLRSCLPLAFAFLLKRGNLWRLCCIALFLSPPLLLKV